MTLDKVKMEAIEDLLHEAARLLGDAQTHIFGNETAAPKGMKALATQIQYANSRVQNAIDECTSRKRH